MILSRLRTVFKKIVCFASTCAVVLLLRTTAFAQDSSSLSGSVLDPSGALVPHANLLLTNVATRSTRNATSGAAGEYSFSQVAPGTYSLRAEAPGFQPAVISSVELRVSFASTVNVAFQSASSVGATIEVRATEPAINTTDASLGNPFESRQILQLPLEGRNVASLLSLQSGVTFLGDLRTDARNGSVNGGRSDQANITLDGVDVNDQTSRSAFTSVLRNTLDSVQEFRVTTIGANADQGRTSGAQIALVTKGGSNTFHGSAYWFHRNTLTSANDFFSNSAGVPRAKLLRNVFGASLGGPVQRNRLFFFFNYEGRRDASGTVVERQVPTLNLRQGIVNYQNGAGGVSQIGPAQLKQLDPTGIGVDPAALQFLSAYPAPNDSSIGDGLNISGFRFLAKTPLRWNTYVARIDWNVDKAGKHSVFLRGNLQNDASLGVPQFPGQIPNSNGLTNAKGLALGYNHILRPNLVGSFRYGLTRIAQESTGIWNAPLVNVYSFLDDPIGRTLGSVSTTPVHTFSEDLTWTKSEHTAQFGFISRVIRRESSRYQPLAYASDAAYVLQDQAIILAQPLTNLDSRFLTNYENAAIAVLGILPGGNATYNYTVNGAQLPTGAAVKRNFGNEEYELYGQDTWHIRPNLTVIAGLRWSLIPPPSELNGQQTTVLPDYETLFNRRLADAANGVSDANETVTFVARNSAQGSPLYPTYKTNFGPRLSLTYSPKFAKNFLTGGPDKTVIRAGAGIFYDLFGSGIINSLDQNAFGLRSNIQTTNGQFTVATAPRFTSSSAIPAGLIPLPGPGGPGTPPVGLNTGIEVVDSRIRPPYTINLNFGISRQFGKDFGLDVNYVGRLSRRQLIRSNADSQPLNFRDPKSGMLLYDALNILDRQSRKGVPLSNVQPVPFWEDLFSRSASNGMTPTQLVYSVMQNYPTDPVSGLAQIDSSCSPACSDLGPFTFFQPQFWGLFALQSQGTASYNSLQTTLHKRFSAGLQFDVNYTYSKSIDLYSQNETIQGYAVPSAILNALAPRQQRAVSDFDMTHQFNANWVFELPFGKGRGLLNRPGFLDAVFGGWQLGGLVRITSGLPYSAINGYHYATEWCCENFAVPIAPTPSQANTKNSKIGGPNIFADPLAAAATFDFAPSGDIGARNTFRGDGIFSLDVNLAKRFQLPIEGHSIQFRAEAFNVTNSVRFTFAANEPQQLFIDNPRFGAYNSTLGSPRVMQFGVRYEF